MSHAIEAVTRKGGSGEAVGQQSRSIAVGEIRRRPVGTDRRIRRADRVQVASILSNLEGRTNSYLVRPSPCLHTSLPAPISRDDRRPRNGHLPGSYQARASVTARGLRR